ncbi:hypothetical protein O181_073238 [Austropuccinia psidii MF-1]|uniref:Reverse transcriptase Ty1/copia-type domain-containing protein n=1 Tax=Austropuccinia psidii MF-1 TaxID=1389203 RepID=A0A9Q3F4K6_9BASI|nr:hypothetical protein [Austropuccinia psidii MF-1]
MNKLKVWDIIEIREDYKLIGMTWGFKIKKNHLNEVTKYNARLCAQGFAQTLGIDVHKTYAPTGRLNSLRTLIAFASHSNLKFHQINIKSAFLNVPLSETVYLASPQGLDIDKRKYCLQLKKAIYGLKQAPLAWYNRLKEWLNKYQFHMCKLDPCVFYRLGKHLLWLYIHIDDIALFGNKVSQGLLWKQEGLALRNQELTWRAPKGDKKYYGIYFLSRK